MPWRFPCTVSIDVKEFADLGTTRLEVVSKIINSFHPIKPVVALQFVGYDAKVTFESEAHKREVMANEYVSIEGIDCAGRGGGGGLGPRMSSFIISLMKYPMQLFGRLYVLLGRLSLFISVTGLMLRKFVMGYVRLGWCGLVPSRAI